MIDLRSDTVTRPTPAMLEFMMKAKVGDDVFGDDPTTRELERLGASLFDKEGGLFCASGTMSNQIALNVHTQPGDEVICHNDAHIYRYEGGGMARNSGISARLLSGHAGRIQAKQIPAEINPDDVHYPVTRLVSIEDTANRGGGAYYDPVEIREIRTCCTKYRLALHLDGARVFNALTETGLDSRAYGSQFDSISVCLSKGLGAPVGTLLLGTEAFIHKARRVRKAFGGGMRQTGYFAAAGIYALEHHVERMKDDHLRARILAEALTGKAWVREVLPVSTNIVVALLADKLDEKEVVRALEARGIRSIGFGKGRIRMVTHLDVNDGDIDFVLRSLPEEIR